MKNKCLSIIFVSLLLINCEGVPADWSKEEFRVNFNARINGITTRASDNNWHKSDEIGVYMKDVDKPLDGNTKHNNAKYLNQNGSYQFTPASESDALYFPSKGQGVDFIAYYPYKKEIIDFKYNIDISSQTNLPDIDFMYSNNASNISKDNGDVNLTFSHQLCKIVINLSGYADLNLSDLRVVITNIATKAQYDLSSGLLQNISGYSDLELNINSNGDPIEAIILPENDLSQKDIWLIFDGEESVAFRYSLGGDRDITSFKKSTLYTYNISLNANDVAKGVEGSINDWQVGPSVDVVAVQTDQTPPSIKGSKSAPYTIAEAQLMEGKKGVWINGYIIGSFTGTGVKSYTPEPASAKRTVVALADRSNETDIDAIFPVELPAGKLRDEVNLLDNPYNQGKRINIKGDIEKYYSAPGLKNPKEFTFSTF